MTAPGQPEKVVDVEKARDEMLNLFEQKREPLKDNTQYYESERRPTAVGIATPPNMRNLLANVGYPRLYINAVAERQELEGFRIAGQEKADEKMWEWWQANDLDIEATLGHTDALVHGRAYITVAAPDPQTDIDVDPTVPMIRVESPLALFARIDPRTRKVDRAIRAIYDEDGTQIIAATLYLPDQTLPWFKEKGQWVPLPVVSHGLGIVPVIPIANRTRLSDLYGTSEITPELRSCTDAAARIMMNMQATAELMAVPQRLLFGVTPEELGVDPATGKVNFDAYIARILAFADPEAKAQQFLAAELRNFTDALREIAKQAAAYTGLPPQYLSSQTDNPASAEAIRASESRLVSNVERKNKIFGGAWEQTMRVAHMVMGGGQIPPAMYRMESVWRDPATPTYAAKADGVSKLYANGMGVIPKERARIDLGYSIAERDEMKKWDEEEVPLAALAGIMSPNGASPKPTTARPAAAPTKAPA